MHSFSPPAELTHSAPRDVRLTTNGIFLMVVAWLLAVAAFPIGTLMYREASRQRAAAAEIVNRGVTTQAVVDQVWRRTGDGKPAFAAIYFDVGGARIYGERRMHLAAWQQLKAGSTVAVRYLPDDPQKWVLPGERARDRMPMPLGFVVAGLMIGVALLCGAVVRWERALLMEGRIALAKVTEFKSRKGSHGETHREVRYEFPMLGGGTQRSKASTSKAKAVGEPIWVVYDPDRPKRNKPYPFSLVAGVSDR